MKKLFLVDGNNLLFRMALSPGLSKMSYQGQATGGVHGAIKSILSYIDKYKPDEVCVVFDGHGARAKKQEIYSGYKANRGCMVDAIFNQVEITINILRAAGIFVFHEPLQEADDVIGALSSLPDRQVLILSNDKDFSQLCSARIALIRPLAGNDEIVYNINVKSKYGIPPKRFAEYLALVGDNVDGIPGLRKCGPKNAIEILQKHASFEDFLAFPGKWENSVKKKELRAFLKLTTINRSCLRKNTLSSIAKRLVPGKYAPELWDLLQAKGLRALTAAFKARNIISRNTVFG